MLYVLTDVVKAEGKYKVFGKVNIGLLNIKEDVEYDIIYDKKNRKYICEKVLVNGIQVASNLTPSKSFLKNFTELCKKKKVDVHEC
ncbi:MAG: hypothetical protein ACPL6C_00595 [bacterium]